MRLDRFTAEAQEGLQAAAREAQERGQQAIEPEHVLLALVRQQESAKLCGGQRVAGAD